jgi:hypothetical protein
VVKAEVDFIKSSFRANGKEPEIIVHEHCGESGAIGAAQEALRLWNNGRTTTFIGLEAVANIHYRTTRNEETRCYFCKNNCLRTFIDVDVTGGQTQDQPHVHAADQDRAATPQEVAEVVAALPASNRYKPIFLPSNRTAPPAAPAEDVAHLLRPSSRRR